MIGYKFSSTNNGHSDNIPNSSAYNLHDFIYRYLIFKWVIVTRQNYWVQVYDSQNGCQLTRNAALAFCVSRSELCSLPCWKLDCTRLYALAKSKPDGNPCLRREYSTSRKSCSMIPQAWFNMAHTPSTLELDRARLGRENNLTLDILNYLTYWPLGDFNLILGR